jgi:hypothetical protein
MSGSNRRGISLRRTEGEDHVICKRCEGQCKRCGDELRDDDYDRDDDCEIVVPIVALTAVSGWFVVEFTSCDDDDRWPVKHYISRVAAFAVEEGVGEARVMVAGEDGGLALAHRNSWLWHEGDEKKPTEAAMLARVKELDGYRLGRLAREKERSETKGGGS